MEEKLDKMAKSMADSFRDYLLKYLMFNLLRQQGDVLGGIDNFKQTYLSHMRTQFENKMDSEPMLKYLPKEMQALAKAMTVGVAEKVVEVFKEDMIQFMKEYSTVER